MPFRAERSFDTSIRVQTCNITAGYEYAHDGGHDFSADGGTNRTQTDRDHAMAAERSVESTVRVEPENNADSSGYLGLPSNQYFAVALQRDCVNAAATGCEIRAEDAVMAERRIERTGLR